jgi:CBS domain-containing protein
MKTIGTIVKSAHRDLYTISSEESVYTAACYMKQRNIGAVTVVEGPRVVGLFSERDLLKRVVAEGRNPVDVKVRDVMSTELTIGSPDESYEEALSKMQQAKVRHLPILEDNQLLGLISLRDLLQVDADEKAEEIRMLNTYINYVPPGFAHGA